MLTTSISDNCSLISTNNLFRVAAMPNVLDRLPNVNVSSWSKPNGLAMQGPGGL